MTIIAAYKDLKTKTYWIGSDSVGTNFSTKQDYGSKLIKKSNYVIGYAGSYRIGNILEELDLLPRKVESTEDLKDIRDLLQLELEERNVSYGTSEGQESFTLLLICPLGIFEISDSLYLINCKDNFSTAGQGEEVALGALSILSKKKVEGRQAITMAVKAAIKYCTHCGGKIYIHSVKYK
jgi:ATP-dependent protease HslVU (ClpYQ) peptidase subunit